MSDTSYMRHIKINENMCCCGIKEITGIGGEKPTDVILDISYRLFSKEYEDDNSCAFMIFSDIKEKTTGKNLEKEIKKLNLGNVIRSKSKKNPNSNNSLAVWIWELNRTNLKKYFKEHEKEYVRSNN